MPPCMLGANRPEQREQWCREMDSRPTSGRAWTSFGWCWKAPALNAAELAEYCRRKGLYVEQINAWREACEQANSLAQPSKTRREREEEKAAKKRIKQLERELRRKDAALAETAALLVLRKSRGALGKDEDE
jgi:transposase